MFIIGGNKQGKIISENPNLSMLDNGDLMYDIDFRSVYYYSTLQHKLNKNWNSSKTVRGFVLYWLKSLDNQHCQEKF